MVDMYLIILVIFTFLLSFSAVYFWIGRAKVAKMCGKDVHKLDGRIVAEMGGLPVVFSFLVGAFLFVAVRVFLFLSDKFVGAVFAIVLCVLIAAVIGIVDDILGWKIGLRQWQKPLLALLCAFPVMAVDAGVRVMSIPFIGAVDLGLLYPFFVIPAVIVVASNASNMIAGFNGLESGLSLIMTFTLGYYAFISGATIYAYLCALFFVSVLGFWVFNKYPARVFPGDTFTYSSGAFLGAIAIFADLEKVLVILFIPFAIEFFLKLRGRFKKESFGKLLEDGSLDRRYEKFYGLEHIAIYILRKLFAKASERGVVYVLYLFMLCFVGLTFVI